MEYQQIRVLRVEAWPTWYSIHIQPSNFKLKLKFGEIWKEFGKKSKIGPISAS
jgi:hypothetical protein